MVSIPSKNPTSKNSEDISFSRIRTNCGVVTKQISGKLIATLFCDAKGQPCNQMYAVHQHSFYLQPCGDRHFRIIKLNNAKRKEQNISDLYPHRHLKDEGKSFGK
jgi:hypothetical protein